MNIIEFETHEVRTLEWNGSPCWLAYEISAALGYKDRRTNPSAHRCKRHTNTVLTGMYWEYTFDG